MNEVIVQNNFSVIECNGEDIVVVTNEKISVISEGIQGPPGASGAGFTHTQVSAATEWIVNHNLGFKPVVEVINSGGVPGIPDVIHMTANQLRVYFAVPTAGEARCV